MNFFIIFLIIIFLFNDLMPFQAIYFKLFKISREKNEKKLFIIINQDLRDVPCLNQSAHAEKTIFLAQQLVHM